jgi:hypothetical protein
MELATTTTIATAANVNRSPAVACQFDDQLEVAN